MKVTTKRLMILGVLTTIWVAFVLFAAPAQAVGESITITGYTITGCPGSLRVNLDYNMGSQGYYIVDNVTLFPSGLTVGAVYIRTGSGSMKITDPLGAVPGQDFEIRVYVFDSSFNLLASDKISPITCVPSPGGGSGGGGKKDKPEPPPFHYAVQPIDDADTAAMLLGTPNDDGVLPCGVFDPKGEGTTGWGYKVAYLPGWPDCMPYTPNLTILCYEQVAEGVFAWRGEHVVGLEISEDGLEYRWESKTDAFCGFFPTG